GLSAVALSRTGSADRGTAADAGPGPAAPGPVPPRTTQAAPGPGLVTPTVRATPGQINPKANFGTPVYQQKALTLHPTGCNSTTVDLDEPRVGAEKFGDLTFRTGCGAAGPVFNFPDKVDFAAGTDPNEQPGECAEAIQTGPLNAEFSVPVREGVLL